MIYLVGGAPRVGKSNIVSHVLAERPMFAASTDAIRGMVRGIMPPKLLPRALFDDGRPAAERTMQEILRHQNAESRSLWPAVRHFIQIHYDRGEDALIEGVAILPELVAALPFETQTIIIGDQSAGHAQAIREHAAVNPYDWLHGMSDDETQAYIDFFAYMSSYLEAQAKHFNIAYIEISDAAFEQDLRRATQQLLSR